MRWTTAKWGRVLLVGLFVVAIGIGVWLVAGGGGDLRSKAPSSSGSSPKGQLEKQEEGASPHRVSARPDDPKSMVDWEGPDRLHAGVKALELEGLTEREQFDLIKEFLLGELAKGRVTQLDVDLLLWHRLAEEFPILMFRWGDELHSREGALRVLVTRNLAKEDPALAIALVGELGPGSETERLNRSIVRNGLSHSGSLILDWISKMQFPELKELALLHLEAAILIDKVIEVREVARLEALSSDPSVADGLRKAQFKLEMAADPQRAMKDLESDWSWLEREELVPMIGWTTGQRFPVEALEIAERLPEGAGRSEFVFQITSKVAAELGMDGWPRVTALAPEGPDTTMVSSFGEGLATAQPDQVEQWIDHLEAGKQQQIGLRSVIMHLPRKSAHRELAERCLSRITDPGERGRLARSVEGYQDE